jgi:hypothetical protein
MKRLCSALLLLAVAAPGQAHFVWLLPPAPGEKPTARVVFSDALAPDGDLVKKVAHTSLFLGDERIKLTPVKAAAGKGALEVAVPGARRQVLLGLCTYGVTARGKAEPYLLRYYAKTFIGPAPKVGPDPGEWAWEKLPLEVVREVGGKAPSCRVLWQGKPLADAEVVLLVPGKEEPVTRKADRAGVFALEAPAKSGVYGVRVGHVDKRAGEHGGKKYRSVRHYATLTFRADAGPDAAKAPAREEKPAADPEATKLLADARAARATWKDFPGFTADVEVNVEGKVTTGTVEVSPKGAVKLKLEGEHASWARRTLESVVGHRLDGGAAADTPCAFADDVKDHPLGRAIRVLNDEFHSSYRIRDRQVIVVNRQAGPVRFTITVTENHRSAEGRFLPACYVVNTWDLKSNALKSSVAHHQTWRRVGAFDLPLAATAVSATAGAQEARRFTLSNHRLLKERAAAK